MIGRTAPDPANNYLLQAIPALATHRPPPAPPPGVDWRERAAEHGVLALLESALPPSAIGDATSPHRFSVAAQLELALHDLSTVAAALDEAGLRWAVFKGPVLGYDVYADPLIRWFTDLDVLVTPEDFGRALTALERHGGTLLDRNWQAARRLRVSELSARMPRGTTVDLHWHVVARARQRDRLPISTHRLLDRTRTVRLGDLSVPTFDELDTVLHLAVHAAVSGGHRLRWLVDVRQAVDRYRPDPQDLGERAREQGSALVGQLMIDRAAQYVDPGLNRYRGRLARHSAVCLAGRRWSRTFPPGRSLSPSPARSGEALYMTAAAGDLSTVRALLGKLGTAGPRWWLRPERQPDWSADALPSDELRRHTPHESEARRRYLETLTTATPAGHA